MSQQQQEGKTVNEIYRQTQEEFKNIRNNCKRNVDPILQRNEKYVTTHIYTYIYSYIHIVKCSQTKNRNKELLFHNNNPR